MMNLCCSLRKFIRPNLIATKELNKVKNNEFLGSSMIKHYSDHSSNSGKRQESKPQKESELEKLTKTEKRKRELFSSGEPNLLAMQLSSAGYLKTTDYFKYQLPKHLRKDERLYKMPKYILTK